jgi:hypothetical protein
VRVIVEELVEWRLAGDTEVLAENLAQRHFVTHKSHLTRLGLPRWEASDCNASRVQYIIKKMPRNTNIYVEQNML